MQQSVNHLVTYIFLQYIYVVTHKKKCKTLKEQNSSTVGGGEHILDKRDSSEKTSDDFIKNLKLLYFMTGDFLVPKSTKTIYT